MRSTVLERKLHLIVEGEMDARILCTLLTHEKYTSVHYTATNGYHNMSSIVSTLRLMLEPEDKMLVVFDSDTENPTDIEDKVTTMSYLTKADVSRVKIGIFALVPDIERALFGMSKQELKKKRLNVARLLKENFEEIKNKDAIKRMQAFIDEGDMARNEDGFDKLTNRERWLAKYAALGEHVESHGHLTERHTQLNHWWKYQKKTRKEGKLTDEQERLQHASSRLTNRKNGC